MEKKLKELQERTTPEHKDLARYVQHTFEAIDKVVEEHRRLVAIQAEAGIKPDGKLEKAFYESMNEMKKIMLEELAKTTQDLEHLGEKETTYPKQYKDSVLK
jgi:hypothetical protein